MSSSYPLAVCVVITLAILISANDESDSELHVLSDIVEQTSSMTSTDIVEYVAHLDTHRLLSLYTIPAMSEFIIRVPAVLDIVRAIQQTFNPLITILRDALYRGRCRAALLAIVLTEAVDMFDPTPHLNEFGTGGWTALQLAVFTNSLEMAHQLLLAGADVNGYGDINQSPVNIAITRQNPILLHLLLAAGADITPADMSLASTSIEMRRMLLAYGVREDPRVAKALTPLQSAIRNDNHELVRTLIGGVRGNQEEAVKIDSAKIVDFVTTRLSIDEQSNLGRTALHDAVLADRPVIVALLVAARADQTIVDCDNCTPLHVALKYPVSPEIIYTLLSAKNAPLNAQDNNGHTPLHVAVLRNLPDIVSLLLRLKCIINIKDYNNETPRKLAKRLRCSPVSLEILIAAEDRDPDYIENVPLCIIA